MTCPIENSQRGNGSSCGVVSCPFWSATNVNGCFHGQVVELDTLAQHKAMTVKDLCNHVSSVESDILQTLRLLKYAEFCTDVPVGEEDEWLWNYAKDTPPFNTPLFSFVTVNRYARMRQLSAFDGFKRTGVDISESLEEFMNWPFERHNVAMLSMELFL